MEWLKGKTYLPVRRQILSEICRLSPANSVRNASERSQNLASAALREPCFGGPPATAATDKIFDQYRSTSASNAADSKSVLPS
jgi:hypothetical protein